MYPRNNAAPPRLAIGQVVQISDGAVQSSGVTITIRGEGQAEATGGGTTAYGADGTVYYTPTQAETNYTAFVVIANKASCFSASITVVTTATSVSGTVDVGAVSGDATAADNLEFQYDGTGLDGDSFPARQSQVRDIAVTGSAINTTYDSYTLTTGTVLSGLETDTVARDGVFWEINDAGGTIDLIADFVIEQDAIPTGVTLHGQLEDKGNNIQVQAYDWAGAQYVTIGTVEHTGGGALNEYNFALFTNMVGTGPDTGKVRVRFFSNALSNGDLRIDQLFASYTIVNRSVGYADGAVWNDDTNGSAGVIPFINGTADNRTNSYFNAVSVAGSVNLNNYVWAKGDSVQLLQDHSSDNFSGFKYLLDMNSQKAPVVTKGAIAFGTDGSTETHIFQECAIGDLQNGNGSLMINSDIIMDKCIIEDLELSAVAASSNQVSGTGCLGLATGTFANQGYIDYSVTAGTNHSVSLSDFGGVIEVRNMKAGDVFVISGTGTLKIAATCTGGTVIPAGIFNIENLGTPILVTEGLTTKSEVADAVWDETAIDHQIAGSFGSALNFVASVQFEEGLVDAIWDEPLSSHITAGSAGIYLLDSGIVAIKLESALEDDGASGWQYTTLALENAPSGGGGGTTDWTATERSQIRHRLGVDGATATPTATPDLAREATLNSVGVTVTDTNVRVLTVAADTYAEFTSGSNEDAFKADVSALATSANLESVALVTLNTNTVVNALNDISASDVNAQIVDVLTVDTFAEPSSVPPATSTLVDMIHWNFTVARNKLEQTSTTTTLRNDADSANIATSTVSDNGSTFTRGEYS